ncbi:hypothetical protein M8C21_004059 [Ambrosia artemisiifolia]|uniref:Uncharacterized protein n=1 Tax=Ambrosia artemisiifolia TaxID=4212 RepID=A0AAD5G1C5_AMBAR|nr:hypothetical protein M8C21_004059 [Ambrosia artemisiifolia]
MASASPALSNNSGETTSITTPTTTSPMTMSNSSLRNSRTLRGLNKPKCINCGNVARSRCPYQACKSCCAKAQNPCHIHVLKASSSLPDKIPSSTGSLTDQHSNEIASSGNAHKVTSLRQLSSNFAQFNNLQTPARARKPLTRKEAYQINEWRFSKLKEYEDRNIEIENKAFDRYMQNMSLLEEVFAKYESTEDGSEEGKTETKILNLKTRLRADPIRTENLRDKLRFMVNNGLRNLKSETPTGNEETEHASTPKKARYSSVVELNKKLSSARTFEDLKSCQMLKARVFNQPEPERSVEESENIKDCKPEQKSENYKLKWFSQVTIHQEALGHIDAQFSSIDEIDHL